MRFGLEVCYFLNTAVQNLQRVDLMGIDDRHSGQVFSVGSTFSPRLRRAMSRFMGVMTRK